MARRIHPLPGLRASADVANGAFAVLGLVGELAGICVVQLALERSVDQDGQLARRQ
jgi:hypothetical protein